MIRVYAVILGLGYPECRDVGVKAQVWSPMMENRMEKKIIKGLQ